MVTLGLNKAALAFSASSMAMTMMQSVFMFYYVKIFLDFYHISGAWFQVSQVLFMIWNAINDPLFAYFQDTSSWSCVRTRRQSILYGGPFFALFFLIPWFSWGNEGTWITGLHLITALFLYDAMYTYVGLAMCCLMAEMSTEYEYRLRLTRYSQAGHVLGSSAVFFCNRLSHGLKDFHVFQIVCVVVAVICLLLMLYTGRNAHTKYELNEKHTNVTGEKQQCFTDGVQQSIWRITWDIIQQRNFLCFVLMNLCQEIHRFYLFNFMAIFTESLIDPKLIPHSYLSLFYGVVQMIPPFLIVFCAPLVARVGSYRVILFNFTFKMLSGITMFLLFMIAPSSVFPWLFVFYILIDSAYVFSFSAYANGASTLYSIHLSDIVDDDMAKNKRSHPISSMVYGTNALLTKPAQSIAPMLVVFVLNMYGYAERKTLNDEQLRHLHLAMLVIICAFPVILGMLQHFLWSKYGIKESHLEKTKDVLT